MSGPRVLLSGPVDEARLEALREVAPDADLVLCQPSEMEDRIAGAEVVAGQVEAGALAKADRLKWVHSWAAGPNHQIYPAFIESDVMLTSSAGNGAVPLAEHAMMLMLMLNRQAMRWINAQREAKWERFTHSELNGKTVGIIGTGHSGKDLAAKCKAFHMRVLGIRRSTNPATGFDEIYPRDRLHDFLKECDFIVVSAPLTPETEGMLGEAEFRVMKPEACYVCFSRGGIADDGALLRALQEERIAGAGLDAHAVEPLPEDSPFWTLPNVIVTPHNGATTAETSARGFEIFRDNLVAYLAGRPLRNVVDKRAGY